MRGPAVGTMSFIISSVQCAATNGMTKRQRLKKLAAKNRIGNMNIVIPYDLLNTDVQTTKWFRLMHSHKHTFTVIYRNAATLDHIACARSPSTPLVFDRTSCDTRMLNPCCRYSTHARKHTHFHTHTRT